MLKASIIDESHATLFLPEQLHEPIINENSNHAEKSGRLLHNEGHLTADPLIRVCAS